MSDIDLSVIEQSTLVGVAPEQTVVVVDPGMVASGDAENAASSAVAAAASANAAAASATMAQAAAAGAATSEGVASTSATSAAASADTAATDAANAATQAGQALTAAGTANSAASTAAAAKVAAQDARDKAQQWADAPPGTQVEPGAYSARHWANQAATAVTGTLVYMGTWDASGGTYPTSPAKGHFYKVGMGGTAGSESYLPGDQIIYNGSSWDKIDNTDAVTSVAGKSGAVALVASDIGGLGDLATRGDADWSTQVSGKPATFPPSAHSHAIGEVAGLQSALDAKAPLNADVKFRDLTATRSNGSGYIFLSDGSHYFGWDGTNYVAGGSQVWTAATFNPSTKQDALGYAPARTGDVDNADFNTLTKPGIYRYNVPTNGPGFSYGQLLVLRGAGDTVAQVAFDYNGSGLRWRAASGADDTQATTWSGWATLWHAGNSAQVIVSSSTPAVINGAIWVKP